MSRRSSAPASAVLVVLLLVVACEDRAHHEHELFEQAMLAQLEDGTEAERVQAATALGDLEFSKRATDRLLRALEDSSMEVRIASAGALSKWRDAPLARERVRVLLAPALSQSDSDIRVSGIRALASPPWRDTATVSLIVPLLDDPDEGVRATVAQALGSLGAIGRRAAPALERALRDSSDYVRDEARSALRVIRAAEPP